MRELKIQRKVTITVLLHGREKFVQRMIDLPFAMLPEVKVTGFGVPVEELGKL